MRADDAAPGGARQCDHCRAAASCRFYPCHLRPRAPQGTYGMLVSEYMHVGVRSERCMLVCQGACLTVCASFGRACRSHACVCLGRCVRYASAVAVDAAHAFECTARACVVYFVRRERASDNLCTPVPLVQREHHRVQVTPKGSTCVYCVAGHCLMPPHHITSHRIAFPHCTASHRIVSYFLTSHRIAPHHIASHGIAELSVLDACARLYVLQECRVV